MKRVYLVTATRAKTEEEFSKKPIHKSLKKLYELYTRYDFEFEVIKGNKEGLSTVYNRYLTEEHKGDIVLFVHDDVIINDMFLVEHLRKSPFAVTGLAGATSWNSNTPKQAWHLAADRGTMVGEVTHIKDGKIWTTVFGPTQSMTAMLDGVFLAVDVEAILKTPARFNTEFNFHHYDMAFCKECTERDIPLGVMPISVIHFGLGDSMLTQDWEVSNKKFIEKYCN